MAIMGEFDRQEGAEAERRGTAHLHRQFQKLDVLNEQGLVTDEVRVGSRLADLDDAAEYMPISNQLRYLAASAWDHLDTLRTFFERTDGGLPLMAFYTLIRSAIEACSYGLWMLVADSHDERVLRVLRMTWSNRKDVEGLAERMGSGDEITNARVRARLLEIRDRIPGLQSQRLDRGFPTMTEIVEAADAFPGLRSGTYSGIVAWKACSGIAHSNSTAAIGMFERRQLEGGDDRGGQFWMTSSVAVVALMLEVAVDRLEAMVHEAGRLNTASLEEPQTPTGL